VLALLKVGFDYPDILAMQEIEVWGYMEAYNQMMNPKKEKSYVVQRGKKAVKK
jgi:hypothetical protein